MPALARRLAWSVLAGWGVVVGEFLVVSWFARAQIASVWELQHAGLLLGPMTLTVAGALGLSGGALLELGRSQRSSARWLLATLVGFAAAAVALSVSRGRHFSDSTVRSAFVVGLGGLGSAAAFWGAPRITKLRATWATWPSAAVVLAFIVALELANRFLLVRLYSGFHVGLSVLALLSAAALVPVRLRVPRGRTERWALPVLVVGLWAAAAVCIEPAAKRLSHFDNFRWLLLEHAPLLGHSVRLSSWVAPPPPLEGPGVALGPATAGAAPGQGTLRLVDRDLLLISVDALRADHVGAYGYPRATTPNIDALSRQGVLFERAYCPTPHTSYSVTSLMTGKYMRPLLLQGAGEDSETWATLLRTYGYRTAGFFPPAVFFIDERRFLSFRQTFLGFEYRKIEFLEGEPRVEQVRRYLEAEASDKRQFIWVHLFGPHEPYEAHQPHAFGDRDIDRYDSEVAAADVTVGAIVSLFRKRSPSGIVILTADHGEEFGEHGGRYHGSSVYEEQVRVPLVVAVPGVLEPRRISETVQTIDLLPTVLGALDIPIPPRIRGRDLSGLLARARPEAEGTAFAETDEQTLLAEGPWRLICIRQVGACRLYDVATDPAELQDVSSAHPDRLRSMRERQRQLAASHGRFEQNGLRAQGRGWPQAILRGVAGDVEVAADLAELIDDADVAIRRKAAELLFELGQPGTAPSLRLALARDEDDEVRRWAALALTRLGQGAPLVYELVKDPLARWSRLGALALAESGDRRGEDVLIRWWQDEASRDYARSCQLLAALGNIRSKDAVWWLTRSLDDVRLRPKIAETLARIGEDSARGPLVQALKQERYQGTRTALVRAIVELGGDQELVVPLIRFLGVPDPLEGGLDLARRAGILEHVGGPTGRMLRELRNQADVGAPFRVVIPRGGNRSGVRVLVRASASRGVGEVRVGRRLDAVNQNVKDERRGSRRVPVIDPKRMVRLEVRPDSAPVEVWATAPSSMGLSPGTSVDLVLFADPGMTIDAVVLVPLAEELPPPPPKPWTAAETPE